MAKLRKVHLSMDPEKLCPRHILWIQLASQFNTPIFYRRAADGIGDSLLLRWFNEGVSALNLMPPYPDEQKLTRLRLGFLTMLNNKPRQIYRMLRKINRWQNQQQV